MPVEKVKVEYKFGIISHSQRLLLEDRLESKSKTSFPPPTYSRTRNHYEINEDFVAKFNDSGHDDQDALISSASKMLSRAKRRVGVKEGGEGDHVNLPKAWAELCLLAQLNNKDLQEESLEVLIASINQAPLLHEHIPSLFFLAMTTLHWLKKTGLSQPFLRTGELKLIKMGHLVFIRLYYFYIKNSLSQGYIKEKQSLAVYLAGLSEEQYIYKSFPGCLLSFRFMNEVGFLICKGVATPPDPGTASLPAFELRTVHAGGADTDGIPHFNSKASKEGLAGYPWMEKITEEELIVSSHSPTPVRSHTGVESIHEVSATLWHVLDVWRCTVHKGIGLQQALEGFSVCGTGLAAESWLDVACAFYILAHTSSTNLSALQTFQGLAAGVFPRPAAVNEIHARHLNLCEQCNSRNFTDDRSTHARPHEDEITVDNLPVGSEYLSVGPTPSFITGLREFANISFNEKAEKKQPAESTETESLRSRDEKHDTSSDASFADVSSVESEGQNGRKSEKIARRASSKHTRSSQNIHQLEDQSSSSDEEETRKLKRNLAKRGSSRERLGTGVRFRTEEAGDSVKGTRASAQTHFPEETFQREFIKGSVYSAQTTRSTVTIPFPGDDKSEGVSVAKTGTSLMNEMSGSYGWPWELVYLYSEAMTSICLHGNSSVIQKVALLGTEAYRKPKTLGKLEEVQTSGFGLADLLKFQFPASKVTPSKDWSWRVRFAAVQGLVRVSRYCHGDNSKDGMCSTAWNLLIRHHTSERDMRVLEALKLAQVEVEMDSGSHLYSCNLAFHIAEGLSSTMLPRLPPVITLPTVTSRPKSRGKITRPASTPVVTRAATRATTRAATRPSLRQEILLATAGYEPPEGYCARMNKELMTVIEDQWRKELHIDEEEDKTDRRKREGEKILLDGKDDGKLHRNKDGKGDGKMYSKVNELAME